MAKFVHQSTKTYCHNIGLSCCFRQWRADSHCKYLHGYSLEVKLVFEASELDERNWVQDFGGLKDIKRWLESNFDHKTIVALDDPAMSTFRKLFEAGLIDMRTADHVGCEAFAQMIYEHICSTILFREERVILREVEVREHGANSAIYRRVD